MKTKIILIGAVVFLFFSLKTNAQQTTNATQNTTTINKGVKYVDKNNDGVCDNKQVKTKPNIGVNFVDKNKDGVCDNKQNKGNGKCCGYGKGNGQGYQHRHGWNGGSGCCKRISK